MLPGSHLIRATYGPGLLGSPNSTACSLVPAAFLIHLMSDGVWKSTAVRSMSAPEPGVAASVTTISVATSERARAGHAASLHAQAVEGHGQARMACTMRWAAPLIRPASLPSTTNR